jgi:CheY-like chemotaxis protein
MRRRRPAVRPSACYLSGMSADGSAPRPRVLLVALHQATRASAWRRLEEAGYDVEAVNDEIAVLSRLEGKDRGFDVLVLDGDFRHMTGGEMADRAAMLQPRMPIVWCTDKPKVLPRSSTVARLPTSSVGTHLVDAVARAVARSRRR